MYKLLAYPRHHNSPLLGWQRRNAFQLCVAANSYCVHRTRHFNATDDAMAIVRLVHGHMVIIVVW